MKEIDHQSHDDFPAEFGPVDRRSFLKLAGFTFAGMAISGCEPTRIDKAIPYLIKPEEITPGKSTWYASTCSGCSAGCGILVKSRDGRPIKVEGNVLHPISKGGVCAIGQAMVLGVYDSSRLAGPVLKGKPVAWEEVDRFVQDRLDATKKSGGKVRFLSRTVNSPTTKTVIKRFLQQFADTKVITYEPISSSAILDAHKRTHGERILPRFHFERAEVIVSFDADFLGTWISPVEYTKGYRAGRTLEGTPPKCSYHVQFESRFSLTGSKADDRHVVHPAEVTGLLVQLESELLRRSGSRQSMRVVLASIQSIAERLWNARGKSLVVSGSNDLEQQVLVIRINQLLGNYGRTVDLSEPSYQHGSDDGELRDLLGELESGTISALFVDRVNPVYDLPDGNKIAKMISGIPLVVSFADRIDETAEYAHAVCPDHHSLESWSDAEPVDGVITVTQPLIAPLGNTRSLNENLARWSGRSSGALDLMKEVWAQTIFPHQKSGRSFQEFWDQSVHDGFAVIARQPKPLRRFNPGVAMAPSKIQSAESGLTLVLYPKITMLDGRHAHNPWLHEVPDPLTKVTWDNYAILSPRTAEAYAVQSGDVIRVISSQKGRDIALEIPVWVQSGQDDRAIAIALGYGRKGTDRFASIGPRWIQGESTTGPNGLVGVNAALFLAFDDAGMLRREVQGVRIEKTGRRQSLACTQTYHTIDSPVLTNGGAADRRPLIQQTSLQDYTKNPASGSFPRSESRSMWPEEHQYNGHHWGMAIDLNACTGCAACVVSCQAENNIPVVGKDEVLRNREMHWIRIDRYFTEGDGAIDVAHQPMLCHHCDNAPCETVCPVQATVHSSEGLNQQVYNRCVGTRYCANNCPYKIRRFNWFDYPRENEQENLVLNPDVTVRSRGVMEKCSFCVQRIQEARIEAKRVGRRIRDEELQTACQQSCPAQAIVFGDMNDPSSAVAQKLTDPRGYQVLAELEVRPSVSYMTIVRNRAEKKGDAVHG